MVLPHNDSKTTESIKGAKTVCTHSTQEAKTLCFTTIKEAKAICIHSTQEAETLCSRTIREAEAQGASQAASLQQSHTESIQPLEDQAIKEDSKGQLDFLSTCQAALRVSPLELCSMLVASYQYCWDMHQCPILLAIPKASPSEQVSEPWGSPTLLHLSIHLDPCHSIPLQTWPMAHLLAELHPRQLPRAPLFEAARGSTPAQGIDMKLPRSI